MVGPSESGKSQLIYEWITNRTFQPKFDKIYLFYQYNQSLYDKMKKEIDCIEFVKAVIFELIDSLKNNGTKYLFISDDSSEEVCSSNGFLKIDNAGRHRELSTIYFKQLVSQEHSRTRYRATNYTHCIVQVASDVMQINKLSIQLGLGSSLVDWDRDATSVPSGRLLNDYRREQTIHYVTAQIVEKLLQSFTYQRV